MIILSTSPVSSLVCIGGLLRAEVEMDVWMVSTAQAVGPGIIRPVETCIFRCGHHYGKMEISRKRKKVAKAVTNEAVMLVVFSSR
jgi:hypothetical protein